MQAVKDDYQPRTLDELGEEAVRILEQCYRDESPCLCGWLGNRLFDGHLDAHRGSAPFARLAGRVVKRLEREGRVKYGKLTIGGRRGYYAVPAG